MLKKTITYEDYFGTLRTEDFYFNLSRGELSDMQMSVDGGFNNMLDKMIKAADNREIYNTFVKIVLAAYGEVSPDGKHFIKKDANGNNLSDIFRTSPAYDVLMDQLVESEASIAEFCNGIMPKKLQEGAAESERKVVPQDHQVKQFHRPEENR